MKLLKHSPNGKMILVGDDQKTGKWYYVDKFKEISDKIKNDSEITISSDTIGNNFHLTFIAEGKVNVPAAPVKTPEKAEPFIKERKFDSDTSIKQTCAHATSRALIALQGQLTVADLDELIERIYTKFHTLLTK